MNRILQRIPDFVETDQQGDSTFGTLEELLQIPWVKQWSENPRFHKFSKSDHYLMAEFRGGRQWYVVGRLLHDVPELPEWNHGIYEIWDNGFAKEITGDKVRSSCGDVITLKDGRKVARREP